MRQIQLLVGFDTIIFHQRQPQQIRSWNSALGIANIKPPRGIGTTRIGGHHLGPRTRGMDGAGIGIGHLGRGRILIGSRSVGHQSRIQRQLRLCKWIQRQISTSGRHVGVFKI